MTEYRCPVCNFTIDIAVFIAEGECLVCGEKYTGKTVDELVIERVRADERKRCISIVENFVDHILENNTGNLDELLNQLKGGE